MTLAYPHTLHLSSDCSVPWKVVWMIHEQSYECDVEEVQLEWMRLSTEGVCELEACSQRHRNSTHRRYTPREHPAARNQPDHSLRELSIDCAEARLGLGELYLVGEPVHCGSGAHVRHRTHLREKFIKFAGSAFVPRAEKMIMFLAKEVRA